MCLAAACLIVVTYLSGLRPAEALNLRAGCCPAPAPDHAGAVRYALAGDHFKGATTGDGTPAPDGAPRQWTVIPPVHTAVAVLEQLTTTRFLFPLRPAWLAGVQIAAPRRRTASPGAHGHRRRRGEVITAKAANYRIAGFISWVNDYARRHGLDAEAIPADPDGPVTISRFRRTIAWHIARLPGGRIALAIQYGHLRTITTSEGYSGRARHGLLPGGQKHALEAGASGAGGPEHPLGSGGDEALHVPEIARKLSHQHRPGSQGRTRRPHPLYRPLSRRVDLRPERAFKIIRIRPDRRARPGPQRPGCARRTSLASPRSCATT